MLARTLDKDAKAPAFGDTIRRCLRSHLSPINAEAAFSSACARTEISASTVHVRDLPRLLPALERSLGLFLTPDQLQAALNALEALAAEPAPPPRSAFNPGNSRTPRPPRPLEAAATEREQRFDISTERDVNQSRNAALELARSLGFDDADAVKVATVVSELARNQMHYAGGGSITLGTLAGSRPGLEIRARDHGPGIPHLDTVMDGSYRSETGLGLGLLGSRRMMDEFEVRSTPALGTTITARKYC